MRRYEILILTIPEITKDEVSSLEAQIDRVVNKVKGTILSFERWGKYKLAYPVRNNDYGVYFLARFEAENDATQEILSECDSLLKVKFNDMVMRFCQTRLDMDASLVYERPTSLEEAPKRGSFFERKGFAGSSNRSEHGSREENVGRHGEDMSSDMLESESEGA